MKNVIAIIFFCGLAGMAIAQNFGIDISVPTEKLDVNGNANIRGNIYAAGNVGIGTIAPLTNLHVTGSITSAITIGSSNYPTTYKTQLGAINTAQGVLILGNNGVNEIRFGNTTTGGLGYIYVNNTVDYNVPTTGTLAMTFASNGSVGIGTFSPAQKLDVSGSIRSSALAGTGLRPVYADANGVLVIGGGVVASGGNTITNVGGYVIHTFTSSGTFTVTTGGNVEVLVVAGGGGGGYDVGAGGGGGGLIYVPTYAVGPGAISVTVGGGGNGAAGGSGHAPNGGNSVFGTLTAIGGGGGGSWAGGSGGDGGSGGGATSNVAGGGGLGTNGQGYSGGAGAGNSGNINEYSGASGGGGAGQPGGNGTTSGWSAGSTTFGYGGNGLAYSISGTTTYYAGGGGSCSDNGSFWGVGGLGGGARGNGFAATANTGGGGGGGGLGGPSGNSGNNGGNGGSGIVIVRYLP